MDFRQTHSAQANFFTNVYDIEMNHIRMCKVDNNINMKRIHWRNRLSRYDCCQMNMQTKCIFDDMFGQISKKIFLWVLYRIALMVRF